MRKKNLSALILILLGTWFLTLWWEGGLSFYILPRYNVLVVGAGVMIIGAGIMILKERMWHQLSHHLKKESLFLFLAPLLLGLGLPPAPLSSATVSQRGAETDLSTLQLTQPVNFQIDSTKRTFSDWVRILGASPNPAQYAGEKVSIKGFVYQEEGLAENEFYLSRFLIRCCNADARPVVLKTISPQSVRWKNDTWLEMEGVFIADEETSETLSIRLEKATVIPVPDNPYIY